MSEPAVEATGVRSLLPTLTGFRWWAALVVFLFHLDAATGWAPAKAFGFGQSGVAFFFVLSGFVLTWSTRGRVDARRFYRRRFSRIYPAHLLVFLIVAVLVVVVPGAPFDASPLAAIAHLTLTQAWLLRDDLVFSFAGPAWSLSDEAFFYLLFPVLHAALMSMPGRRRNRTVAVVVAAGLVATVLLALAGFGRSVAFPNPVVRLPEFVLGIGLALWLRERGARPVPLWPAVALLVVSAPLALVAPLFPLRDYVVLPATALLIVAAAARDAAGVRSVLQHPVLVYLGELSFCFYLVHLVVLQLLLAGPLRDVHWTLTAGVGPALLVLGTSMLAAAALHHGVEKPMQGLLAGGRGARRVRRA